MEYINSTPLRFFSAGVWQDGPKLYEFSASDVLDNIVGSEQTCRVSFLASITVNVQTSEKDKYAGRKLFELHMGQVAEVDCFKEDIFVVQHIYAQVTSKHPR